MRLPPIGPLDPSVPLIALLRVVPAGEPCGVWVRGPCRTGRAVGTVVPGFSSQLLVVHSDLGALLRRVPQVAVWFEGRVEVMQSTFLALTRMLDLVTRPEHGERARVAGMRVRYVAVDASATTSLG
jgi:hypothetical protein